MQFLFVSCFCTFLVSDFVAQEAKASLCELREPGSNPGGGKSFMKVQNSLSQHFFFKNGQNDILMSNFKLFSILIKQKF